MAEFIRRNLPKRKAPGEVVQITACALMEKYPALTEFLTLDVWDEKSVRETGTLLLCFGEGRWRAWLNDRDGGLTAWLSADTLTELLDVTERGLCDACIEWRTAPKQKKGGRGS